MNPAYLAVAIASVVAIFSFLMAINAASRKAKAKRPDDEI